MADAKIITEGRTFKGLKTIGTTVTSNVSTKDQQKQEFQKMLNVDKGNSIRITLKNTDANNDKKFLLFDVAGIGAARGLTATEAAITVSTSFPGGYDCLIKHLYGTRAAIVGVGLRVSDETVFTGIDAKVWNGNLRSYNDYDLTEDIVMGQSFSSLEAKSIQLDIMLWVNSYLAISGTLAKGQSITFLFNVVEQQNF